MSNEKITREQVDTKFGEIHDRLYDEIGKMIAPLELSKAPGSVQLLHVMAGLAALLTSIRGTLFAFTGTDIISKEQEKTLSDKVYALTADIQQAVRDHKEAVPTDVTVH